MADVHVVPSGNLWACEIDANIRSMHETREEAIEQALAGGSPEQRAGRSLPNVRIRERDSHGNGSAQAFLGKRGLLAQFPRKRRPARAAFPFRPRCGVFHRGRLDGQAHRAYVRLAK